MSEKSLKDFFSDRPIPCLIIFPAWMPFINNLFFFNLDLERICSRDFGALQMFIIVTLTDFVEVSSLKSEEAESTATSGSHGSSSQSDLCAALQSDKVTVCVDTNEDEDVDVTNSDDDKMGEWTSYTEWLNSGGLWYLMGKFEIIWEQDT